MPRPFAPPRTCTALGITCQPTEFLNGTWLESESFCYFPYGGKRRRARALCPDGKLRVLRCGIPDTFFTIPVRGGGFLSVDAGVVVYHPSPQPIFEPQ